MALGQICWEIGSRFRETCSLGVQALVLRLSGGGRLIEEWSRSLSQEATRPSALYWDHLFAKGIVSTAVITDAIEWVLWF